MYKAALYKVVPHLQIVWWKGMGTLKGEARVAKYSLSLTLRFIWWSLLKSWEGLQQCCGMGTGDALLNSYINIIFTCHNFT